MSRLIIISVLLLLTAFAPAKKAGQKYFPKSLKNVWFGMSKTDFIKARPTAEVMEQNFDFREVYMETAPEENIKQVVYYLDAENDFPLYELIIEYVDTNVLNKQAIQLLGKPNHEEKEWRFKAREGFQIRAWKYKAKLVIAGVIPGSEWEGED